MLSDPAKYVLRELQSRQDEQCPPPFGEASKIDPERLTEGGIRAGQRDVLAGFDQMALRNRRVVGVHSQITGCASPRSCAIME